LRPNLLPSFLGQDGPAEGWQSFPPAAISIAEPGPGGRLGRKDRRRDAAAEVPDRLRAGLPGRGTGQIVGLGFRVACDVSRAGRCRQARLSLTLPLLL